MRTSMLLVTLALSIGCKSKTESKNQPSPAPAPTAPSAPPAAGSGAPAAPPAAAAVTPCAVFGVGDAEIYSGQTDFGKTKQISGDATTCNYGKDGQPVVAVTIIDGSAAFDDAPGEAATVATLDKAKWEAGQKILTGFAKGKTISVKYGAGAVKSDQKTAAGALQLIASKL